MNNSIRISCDTDNLKVLRNFVSEFLSTYALSDIIQNQIVLAVDEISANLIIHANNTDSSKYIWLSIIPEKDGFLFELTDRGAYFDPGKRSYPDMGKFIREGKKGGLGLALVNRIMDKVEFTTANGTNICRLYKTT